MSARNRQPSRRSGLRSGGDAGAQAFFLWTLSMRRARQLPASRDSKVPGVPNPIPEELTHRVPYPQKPLTSARPSCYILLFTSGHRLIHRGRMLQKAWLAARLHPNQSFIKKEK